MHPTHQRPDHGQRTTAKEQARPRRAHHRQPSDGDTASAGTANGGERVSLYDEVTTRIIAELEAGRVPWVQAH
jgi:hypothetical protein